MPVKKRLNIRGIDTIISNLDAAKALTAVAVIMITNLKLVEKL